MTILKERASLVLVLLLVVYSTSAFAQLPPTTEYTEQVYRQQMFQTIVVGLVISGVLTGLGFLVFFLLRKRKARLNQNPKS